MHIDLELHPLSFNQILSDIIRSVFLNKYLATPAPKPVDFAASTTELSLALASKHPAMRIFAF